MTNGHNEAESELEALSAGDDAAGLRLDQWLAAESASGLSRSRIKQLIEQGHVRLNGQPVTEPKRKLKSGDIAEIALPDPEPAEPGPRPSGQTLHGHCYSGIPSCRIARSSPAFWGTRLRSVPSVGIKAARD